jgi:tripartite-type tricarboxylate transporter receptor subunit TctC
MLSRRLVMLAALLPAGFLNNAWAQAAFPSKPLRIVVPFGAGAWPT